MLCKKKQETVEMTNSFTDKWDSFPQESYPICLAFLKDIITIINIPSYI